MKQNSDCPVYFTHLHLLIQGDPDLVTPNTTLAKHLFDAIAAPARKFTLVIGVGDRKPLIIQRFVFDQESDHPFNFILFDIPLSEPGGQLALGPLLAPDRAQRLGEDFIRHLSGSLFLCLNSLDLWSRNFCHGVLSGLLRRCFSRELIGVAHITVARDTGLGEDLVLQLKGDVRVF